MQGNQVYSVYTPELILLLLQYPLLLHLINSQGLITQLHWSILPVGTFFSYATFSPTTDITSSPESRFGVIKQILHGSIGKIGHITISRY